MPRIRQAVVVARSLEPVALGLRSSLALGEPYNDPSVAIFGLSNAVFALDDSFLEVVAPAASGGEGTAADRHLSRRGEGGYMLIVQVADLAAARARASALGIRTAWEIDLDDIAATHLHPGDVGGTILSIDQPVPPSSWRWAGPGWPDRAVPGRLVGATLSVPDPGSVAARWAEVLGVGADGAALALDDGAQRIDFERGNGGLTAVFVEGPDGQPRDLLSTLFP